MFYFLLNEPVPLMPYGVQNQLKKALILLGSVPSLNTYSRSQFFFVLAFIINWYKLNKSIKNNNNPNPYSRGTQKYTMSMLTRKMAYPI